MELTEIKDRKGKCNAAIYADTITCRHPRAKGKIIRIGCGKMSPSERQQTVADLQKIVDAAPVLEHEAPPVPAAIHKAYFKHIDPAPEIVIDIDPVDIDQKGFMIDGVVMPEDAIETHINHRSKSAKTDLELAKVKRDNARLEARVQELLRLLDEKSDAEQRTPLSYCYKEFKTNWNPKKVDAKPGWKADVLRRVEVVLNAIGSDQPYGSVTMPLIKRTINDMKIPDSEESISDAEKSKRAADIKTFFKWCTLSKESGGLGFVKNPTVELRYLSSTQLQNRRRAAGKVVVADNPKPILPKMPDIRWRTFYALCCYAGGRNSEIASLTWERVDEKKKQISYLPIPEHSALKNSISPRCMIPFPEVWRYISEYKKTFKNPKPTDLLFRQNNGKSYFRNSGIKIGELKGVTKGLRINLKNAGVKDFSKPNQKARRYWESRMRAEGHGDLIEVFAGHTSKVGLDHYTNSKAVADGAAKRFK